MLKTKLIHPGILEALASAGHGATVLIADGNYPFSIKTHPNARQVFLNLAPGILTVTDVLNVLVEVLSVESAEVMTPDTGKEPPVFSEFRKIIPQGIELVSLGRFEFYDRACQRDLCLVIATGEQRIYSNLLLTIGVVSPTTGR